MFEVFNIYERIEMMDRKIAELYDIIGDLKKVEQENQETGWYTVTEICLKFSFCRKKFNDYKNLIPLQKATKLGRFDRYKKTEVHRWLEKVKKLKEQKPDLFTPGVFD